MSDKRFNKKKKKHAKNKIEVSKKQAKRKKKQWDAVPGRRAGFSSYKALIYKSNEDLAQPPVLISLFYVSVMMQ